MMEMDRAAKLELSTDARGGFTLRFGARLLFTHGPGRPALRLAEGRATYRASHGMFRVRDRTLRRIDTAVARILESGPDRVRIGFGEALVMTATPRGTADIQGSGGAPGAALLDLSFACEDPAANRLSLTLAASADEAIWGCGEQYSVQNLRGRRFPVWTQEQGVGRGHDLITFLASATHGGAGGNWATTYWAQPSFVSSARWFLQAEGSARAIFDFRPRDRIELLWHELPPRVTIGAGETLAACVGGLSALLGRQPPLPDWAMDGVWLGMQGGVEALQKRLDAARGAEVAVSAIWAQDWEGRRVTSFGKQLQWNWSYDHSLYPDLPSHIARWKGEGVRFLGYVNCFLATDRPQYAEALAKGFLVRRADGSPYHVVVTTFPAGILDLTNPDCRAWIKEIIKRELLGIGQSGWMADFGEYCPTDGVYHSGEPGESVHNAYPALWARVNREAVEEAGALGEAVFFTRAGWTGTSRHSTLVWAGDQLVNWSADDGLASVILAGVSAGFSGVGYHHSDIGGYTTVAWIRRGKELFMRWAELAAFTPVMRGHEGNRPEANWQFDSDPETLAHFARMSRIHRSLLPYLQAASREYGAAGLPPMRHPAIHYEEDPVARRLTYQYLFGRDLMVAPVTRKGAASVRCWLPADDWVHLWTGETAKPGWNRVAAPLGKPPVFWRRASAFAELFASLKEFR